MFSVVIFGIRPRKIDFPFCIKSGKSRGVTQFILVKTGLDKSRKCVRYVLEIISFTNCHT